MANFTRRLFLVLVVVGIIVLLVSVTIYGMSRRQYKQLPGDVVLVSGRVGIVHDYSAVWVESADGVQVTPPWVGTPEGRERLQAVGASCEFIYGIYGVGKAMSWAFLFNTRTGTHELYSTTESVREQLVLHGCAEEPVLYQIGWQEFPYRIHRRD